MSRIPKYIGDLLYFNDCVVLPGFGGFIASYRPAEILSGNTSLNPPSKVIAFNLHLREDDDILVDYISKKEKISKDKAIEAVYGYVDKIYIDLGTGNKVDFSGIGTFYISAENKLQFLPDNSMNYLPDSFGLTSLHFPVIEASERLRRRRDKKYRETVERSVRSKNIRRVIITAPIVAALVVIPFYSQMIEQIDLSSINPFSTGKKKIEIKETRNVDSIKNNPNDLGSVIDFITAKKNALYYHNTDNTNVPKITDDTEENPAVTGDDKEARKELNREAVEVTEAEKESEKASETSIADYKYHVIAGSFKVQSRARKAAKQLEKQGYQPTILPIDSKGRIRITIGGFTTKEQAVRKLDSLRNNTNISVWVLTR